MPFPTCQHTRIYTLFLLVLSLRPHKLEEPLPQKVNQALFCISLRGLPRVITQQQKLWRFPEMGVPQIIQN